MTRRMRFIALVAMLLLLGSQVVAQDSKKESQLRTVHGVTMDKAETPVGSAIVFLKNTRSNTIRSSISDDQGNYRFSGLDPNIDYEIHAEKDAAQSQTRTISSFDSKKEINVNLKLDRKKT